jgi:methyltransferase (TIGR00027 family)
MNPPCRCPAFRRKRSRRGGRHFRIIRQQDGCCGAVTPRTDWQRRALASTKYVILAAGLDSYALRHALDLDNLTVFEVDAPPIQTWKQARLQTLGLEAPPQLRFAPCDFERSSVSDALPAAGFAPAAPAFISWLGVTQYLSVASISDTLRWAAGCAPRPEIVLTFVVPRPEAERERPLLATRMNVDFTTFLTPDQMTDVLRQAGFPQIEHFTPEQADSAYFHGRSDGRRAPALERLVSATVS